MFKFELIRIKITVTVLGFGSIRIRFTDIYPAYTDKLFELINGFIRIKLFVKSASFRIKILALSNSKLKMFEIRNSEKNFRVSGP